ncbi:Pathogenesis-related protein 1 [Glycine soja]|nr:Pathogenesis-related protein 1 [Glycine soja]
MTYTMRPFLFSILFTFLATVFAQPLQPSSTPTSFPIDSNAPQRSSPQTPPATSFPADTNAPQQPSPQTPPATSFPADTNAPQQPSPQTPPATKQYNLPEYTWDEKLASYARGYLMQRYEDCKLVHSNSNYGENVFWGKKLHWSPSDATYYWYQEKLSCAPPPKACGHFTQVVWRDSQRIGCALQHCHNPSLGMLIACEYDPAGNYENEDPLKQHER